MEENMHAAARDPQALSAPAGRRKSKRFGISFWLTVLIVFGLWLLFSGRFDAFHLALGLLSSFIVGLLSGDLMFTTRTPKGVLLLWLRLLRFIPWILYQIFRANLHVMYLTFHPRLLEIIDPHIIEFDSRLKSDYARTTFANCITLTPGTITVTVSAVGRFSVHCIDAQSAAALPGEMERRIAWVFDE